MEHGTLRSGVAPAQGSLKAPLNPPKMFLYGKLVKLAFLWFSVFPSCFLLYFPCFPSFFSSELLVKPAIQDKLRMFSFLPSGSRGQWNTWESLDANLYQVF